MASKDSSVTLAAPAAPTSSATKIRRRSLLRVRRPAWAQAVPAQRKS